MTTDLRALDIECAKLLGWQFLPVKKGFGIIEQHLIAPGKPLEAHTVCHYLDGVTVIPCLANYFLPYYSSDMNFAMELWEKLGETWALISSNGRWYFVDAVTGAAFSAPTPAEAIARAFVAVYGAKNDDREALESKLAQSEAEIDQLHVRMHDLEGTGICPACGTDFHISDFRNCGRSIVTELSDTRSKLAQSEAELSESARLHGIGGSREAMLMAVREEAIKLAKYYAQGAPIIGYDRGEKAREFLKKINGDH